MLLLNHQQLRRACVAPANVASKTTIFQHLLTFLRPRFLRIGTRLPTTRPRRDRDEALCAVSKVKQQFCVIMGGTSKENFGCNGYVVTAVAVGQSQRLYS